MSTNPTPRARIVWGNSGVEGDLVHVGFPLGLDEVLDELLGQLDITCREASQVDAWLGGERRPGDVREVDAPEPDGSGESYIGAVIVIVPAA